MSEALRVGRVSGFGVAMYPPGATFGPRTMRDYEFVWLIDGDAVYTWDETTVDAPRDSVVLCRPGATDGFVWDPRRPTRHAFFHFDLPKIGGGLPPERDWPLTRRCGDSDVLLSLFRYLLNWARRGEEGLERTAIEMMLRAFVLGQTDTVEVPHGRLPDSVERAMDYIHRSLETDATAAIRFDDLVDAVGVSGPHLCRVFRSSVGLSPLATVRASRLDRAAVLLSRSNYSVKEVSRMCGFATPYHFSRLFSRAFGVPPGGLRRHVADGKPIPLSPLARLWRPGRS